MQNELRCPAILGTLIIRTAGVAGPGFYLYSFFATILNGLKEKLEKETVARLKQLARQLGLKGYSGLKKQLLIDFICDNRAPEDITAGLDALNDKPHPWMRIRAFLKKNSAIITAIGTFLGIISILLAVFFFRFSEANRFDSEKAFANLSQKIHTLTPEQIRQRIEQLEKALKDATTGDSKERKEALKALENGDLKKAQDLLKKIIDRANVTQAENYDNLGTAYYFDEKLKEALPMYTEALRLYRKTNNKKKIAEALNMMGIITGTLGEPQQALKHHREALEIHRKIGYEQGTANQLGNIGVIYSDPGEPQKALQYLNESLTIFKRIEARPQIDKASNIIEKLKRKISQSK